MDPDQCNIIHQYNLKHTAADIGVSNDLAFSSHLIHLETPLQILDSIRNKVNT